MKFKGVCVGIISRPVGIKGQIKIHPYTSSPESFLSFSKFFFCNGESIELHKPRINEKGDIITWISGCETRNDSELLRLKNIYIEKNELPKLENEEYYLEDLSGLLVINKDKVEIGKVTAAFDYGAGAFMDIKLFETGKSATIPFNNDSIIEVNLQNRTVIICEDFLLK